MLAVAVEAIVRIEVDVGALVAFEVTVDADLELEEVVVVAVRRVREAVGFDVVDSASRADVLTVFVAVLAKVIDGVLAGALDLVAEALLAEVTRFLGCGSSSLTWSTRSRVAARSSSVDTGTAAVRLVVRVATRVDGGAATRAGIVVGGVWCCCCFDRKQRRIQGHPEVIRAVCGGWTECCMVSTWPMTFVKFRTLSDSVMNSCPLQLL